MLPYRQDDTPEVVDSTIEKKLAPEGIVNEAVIVEPLDPGSF
jgi:hypothetical protein